MSTISTRYARLVGRMREERGDVPGWVLVTLMTAGLVIVLWTVAGPALTGVFEQAIRLGPRPALEGLPSTYEYPRFRHGLHGDGRSCGW